MTGASEVCPTLHVTSGAVAATSSPVSTDRISRSVKSLVTCVLGDYNEGEAYLDAERRVFLERTNQILQPAQW